MTGQTMQSSSSVILNKAMQLGADLAGFAGVDDLKAAPSFILAPRLQGVEKVLSPLGDDLESDPGEVQWPEESKSVLVIAVQHPEDKPELDWWYGKKSPPGNKLLINIMKALCEWIPANFDIDVFHFPYHIEQGGIYLKDAAVMSGLGCIGRNNMLVTPRFGPRVRLRAMALSAPFPSTGPSAFDPCARCDDLCRKACRQHAFDEQISSPVNSHPAFLPGRDGCFARPRCYVQMRKNTGSAKEQIQEGFTEPVKITKFCRDCEWSCPVGK